MKDQSLYRYGLSWVLVLVRLVIGPIVGITTICLALQHDMSFSVALPVATLVSVAIKVLK